MIYRFGIVFLGLAVACGSGYTRIPLYRKPAALNSRLEQVTKAVTRSGFLRLQNFRNIIYYANITVGNPPQPFLAAFDTGSADTWVLSQHCTTIPCVLYPRYDSLISSSYIDNEKPVTVHYMLGASISGFLSTDVITIADLKTPQTFIEVHNISEALIDDMPFDALVGMAFQSIADSKVPTLFDNLVAAHCITPTFSFYMNRDATSTNGGVMILGGMEKKHFRGNLHYTPLVEEGHWTFSVENVRLGSHQISTKTRAVLDTGASLISAPSSVAWELYKSLGATTSRGDDFQTVDCEAAKSLPDLIFTIGERRFPVTHYDYISEIDEHFGPVCYVDIFHTDEPFWILGQTFLGRYYAVFDVGQKRIGLAESVFPYIG